MSGSPPAGNPMLKYAAIIYLPLVTSLAAGEMAFVALAAAAY